MNTRPRPVKVLTRAVSSTGSVSWLPAGVRISIWTGKRRHGFGQYYMGSDPLYFAATCVFRMAEPPYVLGGMAMMQGYLGAWMRGTERHGDTELRGYIQNWQRRALRVGKHRATAEAETAAARKNV